MADSQIRPIFAVCVAHEGCDDLWAGVLDGVLPDESAAAEGLVRVDDDSGGDYLYPAGRFVVVQVPPSDEQKVLAVASANLA